MVQWPKTRNSLIEGHWGQMSRLGDDGVAETDGVVVPLRNLINLSKAYTHTSTVRSSTMSALTHLYSKSSTSRRTVGQFCTSWKVGFNWSGGWIKLIIVDVDMSRQRCTLIIIIVSQWFCNFIFIEKYLVIYYSSNYANGTTIALERNTHMLKLLLLYKSFTCFWLPLKKNE